MPKGLIKKYTATYEKTKSGKVKETEVSRDKKVLLPEFNNVELIIPPFFITQNADGKWKLVNPLTKIRNLASRGKENSIDIIKTYLKRPQLSFQFPKPAPTLRDFSPKDRDKIVKYMRQKNHYEGKPTTSLPALKSSDNKQRGFPPVLYKNAEKAGMKKTNDYVYASREAIYPPKEEEGKTPRPRGRPKKQPSPQPSPQPEPEPYFEPEPEPLIPPTPPPTLTKKGRKANEFSVEEKARIKRLQTYISNANKKYKRGENITDKRRQQYSDAIEELTNLGATMPELLGELLPLDKESPKEKTPKAKTPKAKTPKAQTPKAQTPIPLSPPSKEETPRAETPRAETPRAETRAEPPREGGGGGGNVEIENELKKAETKLNSLRKEQSWSSSEPFPKEHKKEATILMNHIYFLETLNEIYPLTKEKLDTILEIENVIVPVKPEEYMRKKQKHYIIKFPTLGSIRNKLEGGKKVRISIDMGENSDRLYTFLYRLIDQDIPHISKKMVLEGKTTDFLNKSNLRTLLRDYNVSFTDTLGNTYSGQSIPKDIVYDRGDNYNEYRLNHIALTLYLLRILREKGTPYLVREPSKGKGLSNKIVFNILPKKEEEEEHPDKDGEGGGSNGAGLENKIISHFHKDEKNMKKLSKALKHHKKVEKMVEGDGLADFAHKVVYGRRTEYPPSSKKVLDANETAIVESAEIHRNPLPSLYQKTLSFLSKGETDKIMADYNKDKLFHISLWVKLSSGKVVKVEKTQVVVLQENPKAPKMEESLEVTPLPSPLPTFGELLKRTQTKMGLNDFFSYDAKDNNCGHFIEAILKANDMFNQATKDFIYQDTKTLLSKFGLLTKFVKGITETAHRANVIMEGGDIDALKQHISHNSSPTKHPQHSGDGIKSQHNNIMSGGQIRHEQHPALQSDLYPRLPQSFSQIYMSHPHPIAIHGPMGEHIHGGKLTLKSFSRGAKNFFTHTLPSALIHKALPSAVGAVATALTDNPMVGAVAGKTLGQEAGNALGKATGYGLGKRPPKGSPEMKEYMRKMREKRKPRVRGGLIPSPHSRSPITDPSLI